MYKEIESLRNDILKNEEMDIVVFRSRRTAGVDEVPYANRRDDLNLLLETVQYVLGEESEESLIGKMKEYNQSETPRNLEHIILAGSIVEISRILGYSGVEWK